ncbi:MAG: PIN domain-containing protein [Pseudomonadota bacterium]
MDFILDTNVYLSDPFFTSTWATIFFEHVRKTHSRVVMPRIVWEELEASYTRQLKDRWKNYEQARGNLQAFLKDKHELFSIDVAENVEGYMKFLKRELRLFLYEVVDYREDYLKEIVHRSVWRKKPITLKGEEFRDALLWLMVLDFASTTEDKRVVFISADKAFGSDGAKTRGESSEDKKAEMHHELRDEAKERGVQVLYFRSVSDFNKTTSDKIDWITDGWIRSKIDFGAVVESLLQNVNVYGGVYDPLSYTDTGTHQIIRWEAVHAELSRIDNLYSYNMEDGSIIVLVVSHFGITFDYDYEDDIIETQWREEWQGVDGRIENMSFPAGEKVVGRDSGSDSVKVDTRVNFEVTIKNGAVFNVRISGWDEEG